MSGRRFAQAVIALAIGWGVALVHQASQLQASADAARSAHDARVRAEADAEARATGRPINTFEDGRFYSPGPVVDDGEQRRSIGVALIAAGSFAGLAWLAWAGFLAGVRSVARAAKAGAKDADAGG